jgi:hypothetical protein
MFQTTNQSPLVIYKNNLAHSPRQQRAAQLSDENRHGWAAPRWHPSSCILSFRQFEASNCYEKHGLLDGRPIGIWTKTYGTNGTMILSMVDFDRAMDKNLVFMKIHQAVHSWWFCFGRNMIPVTSRWGRYTSSKYVDIWYNCINQWDRNNQDNGQFAISHISPIMLGFLLMGTLTTNNHDDWGCRVYSEKMFQPGGECWSASVALNVPSENVMPYGDLRYIVVENGHL